MDERPTTRPKRKAAVEEALDNPADIFQRTQAQKAIVPKDPSSYLIIFKKMEDKREITVYWQMRAYNPDRAVSEALKMESVFWMNFFDFYVLDIKTNEEVETNFDLYRARWNGKTCSVLAMDFEMAVESSTTKIGDPIGEASLTNIRTGIKHELTPKRAEVIDYEDEYAIVPRRNQAPARRPLPAPTRVISGNFGPNQNIILGGTILLILVILILIALKILPLLTGGGA